jgi:hypothetical protein
MRFFKRRAAEVQAAQAAQVPRPVVDPCLGDPAARALHGWLTQRNWPAARDFLQTVTDPDDRSFYLGVCAEVDGVQDWIEQWIAAEPYSTLPLLVRGAHGVYWAWEARGAARANQTSEEQFREFFRRLKMAENCLDAVIERDPTDATAWSFLVTSGMGRQLDRAEVERRFAGAVAQYPWQRRAHTAMLQYLCKKWYGSHEDMFAFARQAAAKSPAGSPLAALVADAHIEYWLDLPSGDDTKYMSQPEVVAELNAAADHSVRHPAFQRRPGWPGIHNTFAFAFVCAGDWRSAAQQFDMIGDLLTEWPWRYFRNDGVSAFLELRADAYRNSGR